MGYFTREEFVPNLDKIGVSDIPSLRKTLLSIEKETMASTSAFTELYKVSFLVFFYLYIISCTCLSIQFLHNHT